MIHRRGLLYTFNWWTSHTVWSILPKGLTADSRYAVACHQHHSQHKTWVLTDLSRMCSSTCIYLCDEVADCIFIQWSFISFCDMELGISNTHVFTLVLACETNQILILSVIGPARPPAAGNLLLIVIISIMKPSYYTTDKTISIWLHGFTMVI